AMDLLWRLAADCPSVVIEANFRSGSAFERERLLGLSERPVEVFCRIPMEVARTRFEHRAATAERHPVHVARSLAPEVWEEFREPFGLGPMIEVDTIGPVDLDTLVVEVRAALAAEAGPNRDGRP
ncbi:MAG TPA: hypothetical protein VNQ33_05365, partial [Acidimicrobiales bacterium]|nr:hypothetical protein [Acidimicrobiales bacterium]